MGNYCRRHLSGVVGTVPRRRLPPNSHLLGKTDENILDPAAAYWCSVIYFCPVI